MSLHLMDSIHVGLQGFCRRRFLKAISATAAASGQIGFRDLLAEEAEALRKRGKSMILLWMQGGPSQFETLDPKPGHTNGGPTEGIQTAASGITIAENLPKIAAVMNDVAIIRSMTNKEGSHPRATYQMHTGYVPSGSVKHPSLGSCIAQQLGDLNSEIPSFVSIGGTQGAGFLGMDYEPFVVSRPGQMPDNLKISVARERFVRRSGLLDQLTTRFSADGSEELAASHRSLYGKSSRLVLTPKTEVFDIAGESDALKAQYGDTNFGKGCLLARRLVEHGVTFVEVRSGNWDTHDNNFERCAQNAAEVDPAAAALITDLKARGMLDDTLVVWMGEFGRTPKINPREGRDHYPRVFSMMMAGGGVRGGQVYGASTADGTEVAENPVTVADLFRTVCQSLGVNADHENRSPLGRPMKIVDGGKVIPGLLG